MARTNKNDVIIPELFDEAVSGVMAGKNALMGSMLTSTGAAVIAGDFPVGPSTSTQIGSTITVPYFGTIGDFEDVAVDGDALTPRKVAQAQEQAIAQHAGLAFEVTRWARSSVGKDIYEEGAEQVQVAVQRRMDAALLTAATASGGLVKDVYNADIPKLIDYDLIVDGKMLWGDEQDDIVAMMVHSKTFGDLLKLKDSTGRPLLTFPDEGGIPRLLGVPVGVADRLPTDGSTMSAVVPAGTSPPTVTLSGTPTGNWNLVIDIVGAGTLGAATFRFSTDGGLNWSATITTAASVPLIDTATDSLVGANGTTGVIATFNAGTYNADNTYTAKAALKLTTLLLKSGSLAFWFNKEALKLQTDKDILRDTDVAALHLYFAAHRYRRRRGTTKSGIVRLRHN